MAGQLAENIVHAGMKASNARMDELTRQARQAADQGDYSRSVALHREVSSIAKAMGAARRR